MVNSIENQIMWVSCPFFCSIAVGQKITAPRKWPCMFCNCHVILPVFRARWRLDGLLFHNALGHMLSCVCFLPIPPSLPPQCLFDICIKDLTNLDLHHIKSTKRKNTPQNFWDCYKNSRQIHRLLFLTCIHRLYTLIHTLYINYTYIIYPPFIFSLRDSWALFGLILQNYFFAYLRRSNPRPLVKSEEILSIPPQP